MPPTCVKAVAELVQSIGKGQASNDCIWQLEYNSTCVAQCSVYSDIRGGCTHCQWLSILAKVLVGTVNCLHKVGQVVAHPNKPGFAYIHRADT